MIFNKSKLNAIPKPILILTILALLIGIGLRVGAFFWNTRLPGDINMFALTAREFAANNQFNYPFKYEYSDYTSYQTLKQPYSLHPPLWSLTAGAIAKFFKTDNSFKILKVMTLLAGIAVMLYPLYAVFDKLWHPTVLLAEVLLFGFSPMLIDFSGNGSFYILSTLLILLVINLLYKFNYQQLRSYLLAGVLCGISVQIHGQLLAIFTALLLFWLWNRNTLRWKGVTLFIITIIVLLLPWGVWSANHFGKPFYLYTLQQDLWQRLGIVHTGIYDNIITTRFIKPISLDILAKHFISILNNTLLLISVLILEISPFGFVLSLFGGIYLFKKNVKLFWATTLPITFYFGIIIFWGIFKYRFLVPVLPILYIGMAFEFARLSSQKQKQRLLGAGLLLATLIWFFAGLFDSPPSRYYLNDRVFAANYDKAHTLAIQMDDLPPETVLGYANLLDGGRETLYWHSKPYIYARGLGTEEIKKLVKDFEVRYIWVDDSTLKTVETLFPYTEVILENKPFSLLELKNNN